MADLKCTAKSCMYNEDNLCSRGDIMVGGKHACSSDETFCESFDKRRGAQDSYRNSTCHPCSTVSVDCEASKCVYNKEYKCTAGHVDIKGCDVCDSRSTSCATFCE